MSHQPQREIYTHGHADSVLQSHRWRTVENSAAFVVSRLSPGTTVLDVGCGPGTITADIARRVHPAPVLGIDTSAEVIALAAADHRATNLTFRTGNVYELAEPDGTFDVVYAHQVLQHLGDPVRALAEMRRVCSPGGTVSAREADFGAMVWWPDDPGLQRWLEVYRTVARANGGEPDAGRHLLAWFHAAGYTEVTASASTWCFATADERAWWANTWAQRITESPLVDRAIQLGVASRDDLAGCADAWLHWAEHGDGCFITVHGEVLATA